MANYTVCALYKFTSLPDFQKLQSPIRSFLEQHEIMGTILLAHEGINGTISGSNESVQKFISYLQEDPRFEAIDHKLSFHDTNPFYRTKVRLKKEIVTMGIENIDPRHSTGTYVEPDEWNELIEDEETLLIDTRNEYEIGIGSFKNAINPHTDTFREFPNFADEHLDPNKHKKIAMFCTGGIRCEKSTAYLKQKGFEEVYHLKGGILNYLKTVPQPKSRWEGECFVFDNRVSVNHDLEKGDFDQCHACRMPISDNDKKNEHYQKGISCPHCYSLTDDQRKKRFEERQKQIQLAQERGEIHIGEAASPKKDTDTNTASKNKY
ncbi:MAG: hypothetical protein CMF27_04835 [Kiritimatiellaceae bacterium]|jgi:UPF0176 protein|nr:hypothetical protein [Kiritimatiellaceae bacterium]|tara:strand:- start:23 stop:985 length:963 start_codon:yes stop_codon:yes gene_type:complete